MIFALERLTQPDIEPVSLTEAKRHVRAYEDQTDEDDDISALITVAREWVEHHTGRALVDQSWRLTLGDNADVIGDSVREPSVNRYGYYSGSFNGWVSQNGILLRRSPVIALTSVTTIESDWTESAVSVADYELRDAGTKWPRIIAATSATWPSASLKIEYRAGFANRLGSPTEGAEVVPAAFKHAIKLIVGHFYNNRESVADAKLSEMPMGVKWLLKEHCCNLQIA